MFPGFGEDAPLNLSGLSPAGEAAVHDRLVDGSFDAWADTAARVGYCARPVRLVGSSVTVDTTTGEIVGTFSSDEAPLGVLYRACGNRRADICPSCSRVYARDTFAMIRAGIAGGKTIPASVASNPLLFVTFTAPSFGLVHGAACRPRRAKLCPHGRPTRCTTRHDDEDAAVGSPLCGDCYDWRSAVVWNWWAPEFWRRTTITLRRAVASALGTSEKGLAGVGSVQFAKVAEYQARGLVHFHALIRLDGPDGPGSPAPMDGAALAAILKEAARAVTVSVPPVDTDDAERDLAWGRQLDIRVVRDGNQNLRDGDLSPEQVAGYLAKYATKDVNSLRTPGQLRPHLKHLAAVAAELSARAREHDPETPYRLLGKWAHMLGFRGHFSTKSRRYSITLGRLRRARQRFQILAERSRQAAERVDVRDLDDLLLADDEETTLVIGTWTYQGTGWTNTGDEALARAAAARAREYAEWRAEQRRSA